MCKGPFQAFVWGPGLHVNIWHVPGSWGGWLGGWGYVCGWVGCNFYRFLSCKSGHQAMFIDFYRANLVINRFLSIFIVQIMHEAWGLHFISIFIVQIWSPGDFIDFYHANRADGLRKSCFDCYCSLPLEISGRINPYPIPILFGVSLLIPTPPESGD